MADILLDTQSSPTTPAAGQMVVYGDSSNKNLAQKNADGVYLGDVAVATVAQIASHSANTYYKGMQLPQFGMQAGSYWQWEFPVTKTAGVAGPIYTIKIGANQSTADTTRMTITGPAQTAVVDTGFIIVRVVCRSVGGSGVLQGFAWLQHNLAATGLANTPAGFSLVQNTATGFDNSALGGQYIGLAVDPGASAAWVVEMVTCKMQY